MKTGDKRLNGIEKIGKMREREKTGKKNEKLDLIEVETVLDMMVEESDKVVLNALSRYDL